MLKTLKLKTLAFLGGIVMTALPTGCSHNPAMITIGKQLKVGTAEYGEMSYLNGFAIVDCSRENSGWRIEIDDKDGLSFDGQTQKLTGVKSITRFIGGQVTGYLVDLAEASPDAACIYLRNASNGGEWIEKAVRPAQATQKEDGDGGALKKAAGMLIDAKQKADDANQQEK